jgi:hypothetical protein
MLACIAVVASIAALDQPAKKADAEMESAQLVARGKDFMIHALGDPQRVAKATDELAWKVARSLAASNEVILVHTSLATGKMKVLARSSSGSWKAPAMAIDRYYYSEQGVQEFCVDKERLYVLRYSFTNESHWRPAGPGRPMDTSYALVVFHLESGREIFSTELKRPEKATAKGGLQLRDNGVEAFGARFEFRGTELIKPMQKGGK